MTRPLAVLRPEPGNAATAARIADLGLPVVRFPLFHIRPLAWTAPDPLTFDALLLTSANAVRHAGPALASLAALPVVAVGEATAAAARETGLVVNTIGAGDVAAVVHAAGGGRLLHLAGRDHVGAGTTVVPVYAAEETAVADTRPLAGCVALLHSARAARRLAILVERDAIADLRIAAISAAVRAAGPGGEGEVSASPTDAALVALAARLAAD